MDQKFDLRDRLAGSMIGVAVGDALGVPFEFKSQRNNVYNGTLYIAPVFSFRNGKRTDVVGQYSDDCELQLCILRSAIRNKCYNRDQMILSYEAWAEHSKAMGKNTRALFKGVKTVKGYQKRYNDIFGKPQTEWTQSNGSLMRASILAFFQDVSCIEEDCRITNPHPINIQCNVVYCLLIRLSLLNISKKIIIEGILEDESIAKEILDVIKEALQDCPDESTALRSKVFTKDKPWRDLTAVGKGWVLHGFYCAVWGWYHYDAFQDAIDAIIRRGGDTDTNAAIAGGLIGATLGYKKLMEEERTKKNIHIVRTADFSKGENPRPPDFCLHDFDQMIDDFIASPVCIQEL